MIHHRFLTPSDILDDTIYRAIRLEKQKEIRALKRHRRLDVGPAITFHFENTTTLWWQVQEMVRIEKGGAVQIEEELAAYNPLIPQGQELVATMMIEIDDAEERRQALYALAGIETMTLLSFGSHQITGMPEKDIERTRQDGKTSAVHFLRWTLTQPQIREFIRTEQDIFLEMTHPQYLYKASFSEEMRDNLAKDLIVEPV